MIFYLFFVKFDWTKSPISPADQQIFLDSHSNHRWVGHVLWHNIVYCIHGAGSTDMVHTQADLHVERSAIWWQEWQNYPTY